MDKDKLDRWITTERDYWDDPVDPVDKAFPDEEEPEPCDRCSGVDGHDPMVCGTAFTLTIRLGDDAMRDAYDVGRALTDLGDRLAMASGPDGVLFDQNGNRVGTWRFES